MMGLLLALSQLPIALAASAVDLYTGGDLLMSDLESIDSLWGQLLLVGSGIAVTISVWAAGRFLDRRKFQSFGLALTRSWWGDFTFGLGLGAFLMAAIFLVEWTAGWIQIQEILPNQVGGRDLLATLGMPMVVFIVVGFYEELYNRGYLIKNISEGLAGQTRRPRMALMAAFAINAAVFGFLHLSNPNSSLWSAMNISLAGLFLGFAYILTGQLALPIGLHISWNYFQGPIFGFPVSGASFSTHSAIGITQLGPDLWTGGQFGPEGGLLGTLIMLVGTALIALWIHFRTGRIKLDLTLTNYRPRVPKTSTHEQPDTNIPVLPFSGTHLPSHVIWDWNGTLLDDLDLCLDIINKILANRELPTLTREQYQEVFDFPVRDYYQRLGFDFAHEPFEAISTEFITTYERRRSECHLMDGARQALDALSRLGISQSIISASKLDYLARAVSEYGIEDYFEHIMGLDNHHAQGKLTLAENFLASGNLEPGRILIIGDTTHDAAIARSLGTFCLLIPNGHHSKHRLLETGAGVMDSLLEFNLQLERIVYGK